MFPIVNKCNEERSKLVINLSSCIVCMTTPSYGFFLSDTDVLLVLIIVNEDNRLQETQPADNDVHRYHFTGLLIRASSIPANYISLQPWQEAASASNWRLVTKGYFSVYSVSSAQCREHRFLFICWGSWLL